MDISPKVIETGLVAFTTFFAVIGPIDVAAIYAGLTAGMPAAHRRRTAIKGVLVATGILLAFAFFGKSVLGYLGITLASLKTAGGILLLLVGINMVLAHSSGISSTTDDEAEEAAHRTDISVFPLATPLIAGAGTMGAVVLLMADAHGDTLRTAAVLGALLANLCLSMIFLLMATQIQKLLGVTGLNVISRVVGVLLTALAVQFIFDGIRGSNLLQGIS
ncbi:MarC family protein [Thalassospiraceae bacterium LMO-JJ14]|nr:MarC family protein [Thalassospiraceae bacterium LMO-JJ14]